MSNLKSKMSEKLQTPVSETTAPIIALNQPTLDDLPSSNFIALKNNALEIISDNLKNQPLTHQLFDVVKSPSGGATVFAIPGLSGEEAAKEITGIILDYKTPRAYWDTPDPIEGTPPVCFSRDSIVSHDGKTCAECVYNDFGSKDGDSNAKACKESVEILLLRPDNIMPIIVRVPVSSKLLFLKYATRLIGQMIPISGVATRITLEKATSKGGKPYALFNFEAVAILTSEEAAAAKLFGQKFVELLDASEVELEANNA